MTITIEKQSLHNCIPKRDGTQKINTRPFVAEFVLGKDKKISKNFLKPTFTSYLGEKGCSEEDDQRAYTWEAPDNVPLAIGSCVSYNEFTTDEGMFIGGDWQPMTFFEIRKHLEAEALNAKASKPKAIKAKTDSGLFVNSAPWEAL